MEPFESHRGLVVPLDRADVDTDLIIPKQYLRLIGRSGFGQFLFDGLRFCDEGYPGIKPDQRTVNPDFVLNLQRYQGASILLARRNFGCGSSREHAAWALREFGFRAIIAPSFSDIFFGNCYKNGMLPIVLGEADVGELFSQCLAEPGFAMDIDLNASTLVDASGQVQRFEIDERIRHCLLNGLDDIGLTLEYADQIRAFEQQRLKDLPWLATALNVDEKN